MAKNENSFAPIGEIEQGPSKFEQFLDKNQKNLLIFAIILIIGVAGYIVFKGISETKNANAGAALSSATDVSALNEVISEHSGTPAAATAQLALAEQQWKANQQSEAIQILTNFTKEQVDHPGYQKAMLSLGSKLTVQGKYDEAKKVLSQLNGLQQNSFQEVTAILLGDIAYLQENKEEAAASYEKAQSEEELRYDPLVAIATARISAATTKQPKISEPAPSTTPSPSKTKDSE